MSFSAKGPTAQAPDTEGASSPAAVQRRAATSREALSESAFRDLLGAEGPAVRGYVQRMVGHRGDAEDLFQEVSLKAFERRATLRQPSAFRGWLYRIATHTCLDHLRKQQRWRPLSQAYVEQECANDEGLKAEVVATTRDTSFSFDVHEHIAFCFTCVGRSLQPEQQAALVLREIVGFSNQEAADTLGVSESVLRHWLSDARRSMERSFDGLCALVSKAGVCYQCAGFRQATAPERRGPALPVLNTRGQEWASRLEAVRSKHFAGGVSESLHDLLFRRIKRLES